MLHLLSVKADNEVEEREMKSEVGERQKDSKHTQAPDKFVVSTQQHLPRRHPWDVFPLL